MPIRRTGRGKIDTGGSERAVSALSRPGIDPDRHLVAGFAGGGPSAAEALPGLPWDRVLILMLLHAAAAIVCIVLLTTLTREPVARRLPGPRSGARILS